MEARTGRSVELFEIAQRVLSAYAGLPGVACAAVTGSVAEGCADAHSDIDMTVYYDALPPADAIAGVRARLGVAELLWSMGDYGEEGFLESYLVDGVLVAGDALITGHPLSARSGPQLLPTIFNHDQDGCLRSLAALGMLDTEVLVPGHGPLWRGSIRSAAEQAGR